MESNPKIFLIAWEFPGHNTQRGTALSRRVGILYEYLTRSGRDVNVVTRNHFDASVKFCNNVILIPGPDINPLGPKLGMIRKTITFFTSSLIGDRSGWWGIKAYFFIRRHKLVSEKDSVISFFTPRGTVLTGFLLNKKYGCKWFVDFQDTFDEGSGKNLFGVSRRWFRYIIKKADSVVHVSPEWAQRDGSFLDKKFICMRHCLPNVKRLSYNKHDESSVKLMYYGSLDSSHQYHPFFFDFMRNRDNVSFYYAGGEGVDDFFKRKLKGANYEYLGWLNPADLIRTLLDVSFVVLFSYTLKTRKVVPSKLYEIISWRIPCIIVGEDSGGLDSLGSEFNFSFVKARSAPELEQIIKTPHYYQNQDYSAFDILSENNFGARYLSIIEGELLAGSD